MGIREDNLKAAIEEHDRLVHMTDFIEFLTQDVRDYLTSDRKDAFVAGGKYERERIEKEMALWPWEFGTEEAAQKNLELMRKIVRGEA